ncbi:UNVERIFIED_CONTAM: acyl-coa-binding protein [Hammondia hammondi]|eukprot:XP_008888311.1 acyl-coa-binding protein [Hammondia hammondi]
MASQEEFERAAKYVQTSGKESGLNPTTEQKLEFYKYYKQATVGDCNEPAPGFLAFEAKSKHSAWMSVKGMSQEEAKKKYVEALDKMQPLWREKSA